jgi:alanine dehydrogenase
MIVGILKGWVKACMENEEIQKGVNIAKGKITFPGVADAFNLNSHRLKNL